MYQQKKYLKDAFSLLEVLISFTILGFITLGIYSITDNNIATKERVLSEDNLYINVKMAMNIMEQDINKIYSPLFFTLDKNNMPNLSPNINSNGGITNYNPANNQANNAAGTDQTNNKNFLNTTKEKLLIPTIVADKHSIKFFASSHLRKFTNSKESNYEWIEYSFLSSLDDFKNVLIRRKEALNIYSDAELNSPQIILTNINSILFTFWNAEKKEFQDYKTLPRKYHDYWFAVKVELSWTDSDKNEHTEIRIIRNSWIKFNAIEDWKIKLKIKAQNDSTLRSTSNTSSTSIFNN